MANARNTRKEREKGREWLFDNDTAPKIMAKTNRKSDDLAQKKKLKTVATSSRDDGTLDVTTESYRLWF